MAYSSISSILLMLPGLPQTSTSAGYSTTAAVVGRHITRADSIIDGKISKRYSTPLTPTPPLLGSIAEDITSYFSYRSFYTQDNQNRNDYFDEMRKTALDLLDEIRDGKIDLVDSTGGVIGEKTTDPQTGVLGSTTEGYQSYFDVDSEFDWKFDDDMVDEAKEGR